MRLCASVCRCITSVWVPLEARKTVENQARAAIFIALFVASVGIGILRADNSNFSNLSAPESTPLTRCRLFFSCPLDHAEGPLLRWARVATTNQNGRWPLLPVHTFCGLLQKGLLHVRCPQRALHQLPGRQELLQPPADAAATTERSVPALEDVALVVVLHVQRGEQFQHRWSVTGCLFCQRPELQAPER